MGVTREDLTRSGRYLEMSDADWEVELATRRRVIDCYLQNDTWAPKIHKRVGVLLTGSIYGRAYLKASLASFQRLGFWTALAYDNFIDPTLPEPIDYNSFMPPRDVMALVDTFLLPHHQTWGGVSYPYMWLLRLASGIFTGFDYVLCANGDCVLEKPEGFPALLALMGDADFMTAGPALPREVGTAAFLVKSSAFSAIAKHLIDHVVPFEQYEKSTADFGNTEGRVATAIRELGLTQTIVPEMPRCPTHTPCEQHHVPGGTWYDVVGFRHIHGEHNYAYRYKALPPPTRYLDERFLGDEYRIMKSYEDTRDLALLQGWWSKD